MPTTAGAAAAVGSDGLPLWGTLEVLATSAVVSTTITIPSLAVNDFCFLGMGGGANGLHHTTGYNEEDVSIHTVLHKDYWSTTATTTPGRCWCELSICSPYRNTALNHGLTINWGGNGTTATNTRATFRATPGFRGIVTKTYQGQGNNVASLVLSSISHNPGPFPGGICVVTTFKDGNTNNRTISGTGWALGGAAGQMTTAYYILATDRIETPPGVTFNGSGGSYWPYVVAYFR